MRATHSGVIKIGLVLSVFCAAAPYALAADSFEPTGSMLLPRADPSAIVLVPNGQVLVSGGSSNGSAQGAVASAEMFNPATGTFSSLPPMHVARFLPLGTFLPNGQALIVGGANSSGWLSNAEIFDPNTSSFTLQEMNSGHGRGTISWLGNYTLVAGGVDALNVVIPTAELFDETTGKFQLTSKMITARFNAAAVRLQGEKVLIVGGASDSSTALASTEIYDLGTGTFSEGPTMSVARMLPAVSLLPNGEILVAGGFNEQTGPLNSAELIESHSFAVTSTGRMLTARYDATNAELPSGEVLIAGGQGNAGSLETAEIYDWRTGTFSATGLMETSRVGAASVTLNLGQVLVAGGLDINEGVRVLSSAEVYTEADRPHPILSATVAFSPNEVTLDATTQLTIKLTNTSSAPITNIGFFEIYPAGIYGTSWNPVVSNNCRGFIHPVPYFEGIQFAQGSVPANGSCLITLSEVGVQVGKWVLDIGQISSNEAYPTTANTALLTVDPVKVLSPQSITFQSLGPNNPVVHGATYQPVATASSGLPVTLSIDTSSASVCAMNSGIVSFIGPGTCTIDATQAGSTTYSPTSAQQVLTVAQHPVNPTPHCPPRSTSCS